jgi:hypothetical protein
MLYGKIKDVFNKDNEKKKEAPIYMMVKKLLPFFPKKRPNKPA